MTGGMIQEQIQEQQEWFSGKKLALGLWSSVDCTDMKLLWWEDFFRLSLSEVIFSPAYHYLIP